MLKIEEEQNTYGEDTTATLPEDFQRLAPRHKTMVCEIVRALLRAEKGSLVHAKRWAGRAVYADGWLNIA